MSPFRLRGMPRESLDRHGPQSAYPVQDEGELLPRHRFKLSKKAVISQGPACSLMTTYPRQS